MLIRSTRTVLLPFCLIFVIIASTTLLPTPTSAHGFILE